MTKKRGSKQQLTINNMSDAVDNLMRNETLAGEAQEGLASDRMRKEKKGNEEEPIENENKGLRERWMDAKRAMDLKQRAKDKLEEKVMAPARAGTSRGLRWAWETLIPSWGLSLIYINMHVFLRWIFPSAFCKLGEEWIPKQVTGENSSKNIAGTAFGIVEVIGLLLLDIILFSLVIFIVGFFVNEDILETMQKESVKPAVEQPAPAQPQNP